MRSRFFSLGLVLLVAIFFGAGSLACGSVNQIDIPDADSGAGGNGDGGSRRDSGSNRDAGCTGLACQQTTCTDGDPASDTTVSGVVYAPNGKTPLYNVIVFVPTSSEKLPALSTDLTCDQCGSVPGSPVTATTTDSTGHFTLTHVPAGSSIPLVMQLGKWRRQIVLRSVTKCTDNPLTDANLTRLPKNQSEGDMPHIAIVTGNCDTVACELPKLGIDSAEYGTAGDIDTKKIIFYQATGSAAPAGAAAAQSLWSDENQLKKFDAVILGCNCSQDTQMPSKSDPIYDGMADYMAQGGRVLTLDFQYPWTEYGPSPMPSIMQGFVGGAPTLATTGYSIADDHPKGKAAKEWLAATDPTKTYAGGQFDLSPAFGNFGHVDTSLATTWVTGPSNDIVMSYTLPLSKDAGQRCGKMTYFDGHVSETSEQVTASFPTGCDTAFTQQSSLFTFFFMDMFSCIQDDTAAPIAPH